jgi:glycosyltransferase involved in cell wall biosynthesis
LSQVKVDIEVVVIDDGSTDATREVLARFEDERVRVLSLPTSSGVSAARNRGIEDARGAWIAFLDDDDLWAPTKIARQLEAVSSSKRRWAYGGDVTVDAELRVVAGSPPPSPARVMESLARYNAVPAGGSNVMVQRRALDEVGPFDPGLSKVEDWDMWIRLAGLGPPAWVKAPVVACRVHRSNAGRDVAAMVTEPEVLRSRYGIPVDRPAMLRRAAWTRLRAGDRRGSLAFYARAIAAGDLRSAGRALFALFHPYASGDRAFKLLTRRDEDAGWRTEAQRWVDALVASPPVR